MLQNKYAVGKKQRIFIILKNLIPVYSKEFDNILGMAMFISYK